MDPYMWIIENKEMIKIFYSLIVVAICTLIVVRTHKLFNLSLHTGIRFFRNAFLFYGIGFSLRYFVGSRLIYESLLPSYHFFIDIFFEFFLIMAGFFLLYSLVWRKFESPSGPYSSLFNLKILTFYVMALVLVFLNYIWNTSLFMYLSQIFIFFFASIISYKNYKKNKKPGHFLKFYFVAMLMSFVAWTLNFLAGSFFNWNQTFLLNVYGLNLVVFMLFLYGVKKVTK